ncbi:hypothetical protein, partial [Microbacterium sp. A20]
LNPKVDGPPVPGVAFRPSDETDTDTGTDAGTDAGIGTGTGTGAEASIDTEVGAGETRGLDDDVLPSGDPGRMIDPRSRSQKQHDTLAA